MFSKSLFLILIGSCFCAIAQAASAASIPSASSRDSIVSAPAPLSTRQGDPDYSWTPPHAHPESDPEAIPPDMAGKAYLWALAGTFAPVAAAYLISNSSDYPGLGNPAVGFLAFSGALFGPSAGQFYARSPGQAFLGIGIRTAGTVLAVAGAASAFSDALCGDDGESQCSDHGGGGLAIAGLFTYGIGVAYSLVDTRAAVYRYEDRRSGGGFGWSPTLQPGRYGELMAGALAWMRF